MKKVYVVLYDFDWENVGINVERVYTNEDDCKKSLCFGEYYVEVELHENTGLGEDTTAGS